MTLNQSYFQNNLNVSFCSSLLIRSTVTFSHSGLKEAMFERYKHYHFPFALILIVLKTLMPSNTIDFNHSFWGKEFYKFCPFLMIA